MYHPAKWGVGLSQGQHAQLTSIVGRRGWHVADSPVRLEPLPPQHAFQQQGSCHQLLQSCIRIMTRSLLGGGVGVGGGAEGWCQCACVSAGADDKHLIPNCRQHNWMPAWAPTARKGTLLLSKAEEANG